MLQNKIAVVTGGTRGIGYAIVQKFLQNGAESCTFWLPRGDRCKSGCFPERRKPGLGRFRRMAKADDAAAMAERLLKSRKNTEELVFS